MKYSIFLKVVLVSLLLNGPVQAAETVIEVEAVIEVEGAWVRSLPKVSRVNSGYMVIYNRGTKDDRLISARTPMANVTEMHQTVESNGIVQMLRVDGGMALPAGGRIELRSGGYHLMLMQLKRSPAKGESVMIYLTFEEAGEVAVKALAQAGAPALSAQQVSSHTMDHSMDHAMDESMDKSIDKSMEHSDSDHEQHHIR